MTHPMDVGYDEVDDLEGSDLSDHFRTRVSPLTLDVPLRDDGPESDDDLDDLGNAFSLAQKPLELHTEPLKDETSLVPLSLAQMRGYETKPSSMSRPTTGESEMSGDEALLEETLAVLGAVVPATDRRLYTVMSTLKESKFPMRANSASITSISSMVVSGNNPANPRNSAKKRSDLITRLFRPDSTSILPTDAILLRDLLVEELKHCSRLQSLQWTVIEPLEAQIKEGRCNWMSLADHQTIFQHFTQVSSAQFDHACAMTKLMLEWPNTNGAATLFQKWVFSMPLYAELAHSLHFATQLLQQYQNQPSSKKQFRMFLAAREQEPRLKARSSIFMPITDLLNEPFNHLPKYQYFIESLLSHQAQYIFGPNEAKKDDDPSRTSSSSASSSNNQRDSDSSENTSTVSEVSSPKSEDTSAQSTSRPVSISPLHPLSDTYLLPDDGRERFSRWCETLAILQQSLNYLTKCYQQSTNISQLRQLVNRIGADAPTNLRNFEQRKIIEGDETLVYITDHRRKRKKRGFVILLSDSLLLVRCAELSSTQATTIPASETGPITSFSSSQGSSSSKGKAESQRLSKQSSDGSLHSPTSQPASTAAETRQMKKEREKLEKERKEREKKERAAEKKLEKERKKFGLTSDVAAGTLPNPPPSSTFIDFPSSPRTSGPQSTKPTTSTVQSPSAEFQGFTMVGKGNFSAAASPIVLSSLDSAVSPREAAKFDRKVASSAPPVGKGVSSPRETTSTSSSLSTSSSAIGATSRASIAATSTASSGPARSPSASSISSISKYTAQSCPLRFLAMLYFDQLVIQQDSPHEPSDTPLVILWAFDTKWTIEFEQQQHKEAWIMGITRLLHDRVGEESGPFSRPLLDLFTQPPRGIPSTLKRFEKLEKFLSKISDHPGNPQFLVPPFLRFLLQHVQLLSLHGHLDGDTIIKSSVPPRNNSQWKSLKRSIVKDWKATDLSTFPPAFTLALLCEFLAKMKEPLIPWPLADAVASQWEEDEVTDPIKIGKLVSALPPFNYYILAHLVQSLHQVHRNQFAHICPNADHFADLDTASILGAFSERLPSATVVAAAPGSDSPRTEPKEPQPKAERRTVIVVDPMRTASPLLSRYTTQSPSLLPGSPSLTALDQSSSEDPSLTRNGSGEFDSHFSAAKSTSPSPSTPTSARSTTEMNAFGSGPPVPTTTPGLKCNPSAVGLLLSGALAPSIVRPFKLRSGKPIAVGNFIGRLPRLVRFFACLIDHAPLVFGALARLPIKSILASFDGLRSSLETSKTTYAFGTNMSFNLKGEGSGDYRSTQYGSNGDYSSTGGGATTPSAIEGKKRDPRRGANIFNFDMSGLVTETFSVLDFSSLHFALAPPMSNTSPPTTSIELASTN